MAFAGLTTDKSASAYRSGEAGAEWCNFPVTGNVEVKLALAPCEACTKKDAHGPPCELVGMVPLFGEKRHEKVALAERWDVDSLRELFVAVWLANYVAYGVPIDLINNAGVGNNISQEVGYEVISASGTRLGLRGPNPKRLGFSLVSLNPDWPLSDDGRLESTGVVQAMAPGACVYFEAPSVLASKCQPLIKKIYPPASNAALDVEFEVELSQSVDHAMVPEDLAFPPGDGKYYCTVVWYALFPAPWPFLDVPAEAQFTEKEETIAVGSVPGSGRITLRGTGGANTRVLYPSMLEGCWSVVVRRSSGLTDVLTDVEIEGRLQTVQLGRGSWVTTLDVGDLVAEGDVSEFVLGYMPEAVSGDVYLQQFAGSCANCQRDHSGSWKHDGAKRCAKVSSSGFGAYKENCWQPDCDGFCLGNESDAYEGGRMERAPVDVRRSIHLARLWHDDEWVLKQGIPGLAAALNFSYERVGIPSIGQLLGQFLQASASRRLPGGVYESKEPLFKRGMKGGDIDEVAGTIELWSGLFARAEEVDVNGDPEVGFCGTYVAGWTPRSDGFGGTLGDGLELLPESPAGGMQLYDFATGSQRFGMSSVVVDNVRVYVSGVELVEDAVVSAVARGRV